MGYQNNLSDFYSVSAYGFPYGAASYLHQYPPQDISQTSNPVFNFRLASSTPDPDKRLAGGDQSGESKLPSNIDPSTQEIPERDISSVSSATPTLSHLRNMADMIDIYKQLETNKALQLQETAFMQTEKIADHQGNLVDLDQLRRTVELQRRQQGSQNVVGLEVTQSSPLTGTGSLTQSIPQIGTGSLGFVPGHPQTGFQPIQSLSSDSLGLPTFSQLMSGNQQEVRRDSNITAFQPYLSRDSLGFQPPPSWYKETISPQTQTMTTNNQQSQQKHSGIETLPLSQQPINEGYENKDPDEPLSGRSEKSGTTSDTSRGTDYVPLPKPDARKSVEPNADSNIVFQKQNGLYQIHHKTEDGKATSPIKTALDLDRSESSKSNHSSGKSPVKAHTEKQKQLNEPVIEQNVNIHEAPERDIPQNTPVKAQQTEGQTFTVETNQSQNVSDMTSTPRNQDTSGTGSSSSSQGKIVFIPTPNDSSTQNVIGYIPGLPIIPGSNQPINLPVAYGINPAQVAQLASQTSGSSGSQDIGGNQGQQVTSQNVSGTSYHSAAYAQAVAAGDIGVRKLRYLLKELRECTKVTSKLPNKQPCQVACLHIATDKIFSA